MGRDAERRWRLGSGTAAEAALARARSLREASFEALTAIIANEAPSDASLRRLREHWISGTGSHELRVTEGRLVPSLRQDAADLDLVAALIAYRLVRDVLAMPIDRVRLCEGTDCGWLFFDSSKSGRRRWCDMAVCGNAAKARRFQARARGQKLPRKR